MLLHMYQIFGSLLGHLHFFVHFFLAFLQQTPDTNSTTTRCLTFLLACWRGFITGYQFWKGFDKNRFFAIRVTNIRPLRFRRIEASPATMLSISGDQQLTWTAVHVVGAN